jgi:hypothetical protein
MVMPDKPARTIQSGKAFDKVAKFIEQTMEMSTEEKEKKIKSIEPELYTLFNRLERLHAISDKFQQIDLSKDLYTLLRMIEHRKAVKYFPLLSRTALI